MPKCLKTLPANFNNEKKHHPIYILGPLALAGMATYAIHHVFFVFWPGADAGSGRRYY